MKYPFLLLFTALLASCKHTSEVSIKSSSSAAEPVHKTSIVVLGTAQDAGAPQIACKKDCCAERFTHPELRVPVVSLGLIDAQQHKTYIFEATPDLPEQMKSLVTLEPLSQSEIVDGIFLTHAHIGHYTGLMYLGKEAMDAKNTPLYIMPKMEQFLTENGPWNQLITRNNVSIKPLKHNLSISLSNEIEVTPILVPHRDEYSETVGYRIKGPHKSALFIPDIDKWHKWENDIAEEVKAVDYAFLDATFFSGEEMNSRDISEIPHPFVIESLETFKTLSPQERSKIIFIHFNHTNPLLNPQSEAYKTVLQQGYGIAQQDQVYEL